LRAICFVFSMPHIEVATLFCCVVRTNASLQTRLTPLFGEAGCCQFPFFICFAVSGRNPFHPYSPDISLLAGAGAYNLSSAQATIDPFFSQSPFFQSQCSPFQFLGFSRFCRVVLTPKNLSSKGGTSARNVFPCAPSFSF